LRRSRLVLGFRRRYGLSRGRFGRGCRACVLAWKAALFATKDEADPGGQYCQGKEED
jgi:pyruvate formate-lyase activating enzyme-like uncharacterized protein